MSILSEPVKHDLSDILKELKFGRPKADQDLIDKWMKELEPTKQLCTIAGPCEQRGENDECNGKLYCGYRKYIFK